jgi:hypothetical protein
MTMRRVLAAIGFLLFGFAAGYLADSIGAVRAQAVTVTAVSTVDENLAAVVVGGRVYSCSGVRSNSWTCRAVQLKLPE